MGLTGLDCLVLVVLLTSGRPDVLGVDEEYGGRVACPWIAGSRFCSHPRVLSVDPMSAVLSVDGSYSD